MARAARRNSEAPASESEGLRAAADLMMRAMERVEDTVTEGYLLAARDLVLQYAIRARHGRHHNPLLAIVSNPRKGRRRNASDGEPLIMPTPEEIVAADPDALMSTDVLALAYVKRTDGQEYVHGFGNADITLDSGPHNELIVGGLHTRTGIEMISVPDGSLLLRHPDGLPIWADL